MSIRSKTKIINRIENGTFLIVGTTDNDTEFVVTNKGNMQWAGLMLFRINKKDIKDIIFDKKEKELYMKFKFKEGVDDFSMGYIEDDSLFQNAEDFVIEAKKRIGLK